MPRTAGVSSSSRVWLTFLSPRPSTVARWLALVPIGLLTRVTFSVFLLMTSLRSIAAGRPVAACAQALAEDLLDRLATLGRDLGRGADLRKRVQGRPNDVVGIVRAVALGDHARDAHDLEHRTHRAAGDDAGAFGCRGDEDLGGAVATDHPVVDGPVAQGHLDHLAAGPVHRLLHGPRHLARLALAHADASVAIADHRQRRETEDPAALDDLGDAVDADHLLAKTVVAFLAAHSCLNLSHVSILYRPAQNFRPASRAASARAFTRPW